MEESKINNLINNIREHGKYPKEYDVDYKKALNTKCTGDNRDIFLSNFFVDILAFANSEGGLIFLGFEEGGGGKINDIGLSDGDLAILDSIEIASLVDKIHSFTKIMPDIELQSFKISSRSCYWISIKKSDQILIPDRDESGYKLKAGRITYRKSGRNCHANMSSSEMEFFIQRKVNQKSKDYLAMWKDFLPNMVDINPKNILIINPKEGTISAFGKNLVNLELKLSNKDRNGLCFTLNTIQASDIDKIDDTGKNRVFKMNGTIDIDNNKSVVVKERSDKITMTSFIASIKEKSKYIISGNQVKKVCHYLGITNTDKFELVGTKKTVIDESIILKDGCLFVSLMGSHTGRKRIFFTNKCLEYVINTIKIPDKQIDIFGERLNCSK